MPLPHSPNRNHLLAASPAAEFERSGLEASAWECYAVVKKELNRLLSDVRYRQPA
jgi:hypothetical protein